MTEMDENRHRARNSEEISAAVEKCMALCGRNLNRAWLELYVAGLMAVGWLPDDAEAVKTEVTQMLEKGK
jgi:hypothetical protein